MALSFFYNRSRNTHLWLVYQALDGFLRRTRTDAVQDFDVFGLPFNVSEKTVVTETPFVGEIVAGIYCTTPELADFRFSRVIRWAISDRTQHLKNVDIRCEVCGPRFQLYKRWLAKGGRQRTTKDLKVKDTYQEHRRERWRR